eukprot:CAMPEP_0206411634 /NCGR_PEP_ID=MMETSP0294-20121207/33415_1 /ASSEMBLY_ACC=CAM_ASM_000327 /TAXON_ID=39354 /ORGANISM="Heterosigma akashiwo, Strain CCMP2393" /LENGTH=120 /DNA_ID=CAMNT_0053872429 /DNA_START=44 /DNA_END=403 /DNA_ORIENTATION=-
MPTLKKQEKAESLGSSHSANALDTGPLGKRAVAGGIGEGAARDITDRVAAALAARAQKSMARPPPVFDDDQEDIFAQQANFPQIPPPIASSAGAAAAYPEKLRSEVEQGKSAMVLSQSPE